MLLLLATPLSSTVTRDMTGDTKCHDKTTKGEGEGRGRERRHGKGKGDTEKQSNHTEKKEKGTDRRDKKDDDWMMVKDNEGMEGHVSDT